jgi:hypothetical protein
MKRKKALFGLVAIPLALLLSGCFVLQGFWIKANVITAGGKATKAVFQIRPVATADDTRYQFFLIGVDDSNELKAGKARWGTNRVYGGPYPLPVSPNLATVIGSDCTENGFNLADVTNTTWRGYMTPEPVNDRNKVKKNVIVEVGLKAVPTATGGAKSVLGVTGVWLDVNENEVPEAGDVFDCTGIASVSVQVKAA